MENIEDGETILKELDGYLQEIEDFYKIKKSKMEDKVEEIRYEQRRLMEQVNKEEKENGKS